MSGNRTPSDGDRDTASMESVDDDMDDDKVVSMEDDIITRQQRRRDTHTVYRLCPLPKCKAKPQKRLADHIRICHSKISPRKRKALCRMARGVPKTYLRPVLGQKKLTFTSKEPEEDFAPIFGDIAEGANKEARARALQPGKKGTTRFMPSFPDNHKKLIDFRRYLMSVEGTGKSSKVAKETSSDISKILYHANRSELTWSSLTERARLLSFFERCSALGVGPEGRLSKMERLNDAFRYMRFCLHSGPSTSKNFTMLSDIDAVEQSVNQWKTVLRREKKRLNITRLERAINSLPNLGVVSDVVDNPDLAERFKRIVSSRKEGITLTEEELTFAVAAAAVPLMLQSSSRPGAVVNMTQAEFELGRETDGLYIVSVSEHKTGVSGSCKLMFTTTLLERVKEYRDYIRPVLVAEKGDIPNLFVLSGSRAIEKFSNLSRVLATKLKINVPSATDVRKIGTTAVARACSKEDLALVSKQMNHDTATSEHYYNCTRADRDATKMFKTIEKLRSASESSPVTTTNVCIVSPSVNYYPVYAHTITQKHTCMHRA